MLAFINGALVAGANVVHSPGDIPVDAGEAACFGDNRIRPVLKLGECFYVVAIYTHAHIANLISI